MRKFRNWLWKKVTHFLTSNTHESEIEPSNFERLRYEIRPCDVLLVEGRSRVSEIIKTITLSHWTHSALYIGRLHDIDDPAIRELIKQHYPADPNEQLVLEALLGQGTVITPLSDYQNDNLRICRPNGVSRRDSQAIIAYCARKLGTDYDVRQLLDLARFLFPYGLLPRRWRSSLFEQNAGEAAETVCSTMLADAFASVRFPILPVIKRSSNGNLLLHSGNSKLITPRDFDYSPYFDIIKYPVFGTGELEVYRRMPWDENGRIVNDELNAASLHPHNKSGTSHKKEMEKSDTSQNTASKKKHISHEQLEDEARVFFDHTKS